MVFLLAVGLNPLRAYLQKVVDRYFFRGQVVYREMQQAFGHELTQQMELAEIVGLLRRYITQALTLSQLHIYVYDPLSAHYTATENASGTMTSDVHFPMNSALVQVLSRRARGSIPGRSWRPTGYAAGGQGPAGSAGGAAFRALAWQTAIDRLAGPGFVPLG